MNLNINFYKFFDFTALGQAVILSSLSFLTIDLFHNPNQHLPKSHTYNASK